MSDLEELGREFRAGMERLDSAIQRLGQPSNSNVVRLEGAGSIWNGIAIGVALGAAIVCTAWVSSTLQNIQEIQRNNEAFIQATYQQAPEIRQRFDEIRKDQDYGQKNSP